MSWIIRDLKPEVNGEDFLVGKRRGQDNEGRPIEIIDFGKMNEAVLFEDFNEANSFASFLNHVASAEQFVLEEVEGIPVRDRNMLFGRNRRELSRAFKRVQ